MGEEQTKALRVFISAPAHNEPQRTGVESIHKAVVDAGFEPLFSDSQDPKDRMVGLRNADLVIGWTDGLLPPGLSVHAVTNMQNQLQLQFPPQIQQVIDAGWAAMRGNNPMLKGRKNILLPGEIEQQADSPKGFTLGLGQGGAVVRLCSPPINMPEGNVVTELGVAMALDIPYLVLAMAPGGAGDYFLPGVAPMVSSFESLGEALKAIAAAPSIKEGVAQVLQDNIEELRKLKEEMENESDEEGSEPPVPGVQNP